MIGRAMGVLGLAAVMLTLLLAGTASAAKRYAAPGGTGADPCAKPAKPCSLFTAADENAPRSSIAAGDVVVLAPGTYGDLYREIGEIATVKLPQGVTVRGAAGKRRPVLLIRPNEETGSGAFYVPADAEVADLVIRNRSGHSPAIDIGDGGTMTRVIARSNASGEPACSFLAGTIRDSTCLNDGGGAAIGCNCAWYGTRSGFISDSRLIATRPGSVGMEFILQRYRGEFSATIEASGVLVRGGKTDIHAEGVWQFGEPAAKIAIELKDSSYATVETSGSATVTAPGTNGNVIPARSGNRPRLR